jgi:hypothetical protein
MAAEEDVNELIEQFHLAQGELFKGNPETYEDAVVSSRRRKPRCRCGLQCSRP